MSPWVNDIDYDLVLLELHNFLKNYPNVWWKDKNDTPLRTVKTILHSLTKMKGDTIMQHMNKIPNPKESEIEVYILRVLKVLMTIICSIKFDISYFSCIDIKDWRSKTSTTEVGFQEISNTIHARVTDGYIPKNWKQGRNRRRIKFTLRFLTRTSRSWHWTVP